MDRPIFVDVDLIVLKEFIISSILDVLSDLNDVNP